MLVVRERLLKPETLNFLLELEVFFFLFRGRQRG